VKPDEHNGTMAPCEVNPSKVQNPVSAWYSKAGSNAPGHSVEFAGWRQNSWSLRWYLKAGDRASGHSVRKVSVHMTTSLAGRSTGVCFVSFDGIEEAQDN
jgi:hypothetical protein